MIDELKHTAEQVVERARKNGATAADVFIREDEAFSVTVRMGEVETLKEAVSRGLRLRLYVGKRTATSQTSDLSMPLLEKLVDETIEMARLTSEDDSGGLPDRSLFPAEIPNLELLDPSWEKVTPAERIEWARRAEAASMSADPLVTNSEGGSLEMEKSRTVLANTEGFIGAYEGTAASLSAVPIAQANGAMQRDYWVSVVRHRDKLELPEDIGRKAASRVVRRLNARRVKTCEVPVVFDPLTARTLVGHVFQAVAGDSIYRRSSFLVDRIGDTVASEQIRIVDDSRLPGGLGSSPFDDEGVGSQTTPIIEEGRLLNYLHSAYSARKLNARATGNGSRTGTGSVSVGPTNFYLQPGSHTAQEIIESVRSGLYVVELIGFGVNGVTGDYSRGVVGIWIENGKLAYPVQEVTIAGNLRQMLKDIEMIGNDVIFMGSIAAPTLKLKSMVVSGQ